MTNKTDMSFFDNIMKECKIMRYNSTDLRIVELTRRKEKEETIKDVFKVIESVQEGVELSYIDDPDQPRMDDVLEWKILEILKGELKKITEGEKA